MYRGIRLRIPDLPDQLNIDRYFSLRMFKSGIVLEGLDDRAIFFRLVVEKSLKCKDRLISGNVLPIFNFPISFIGQMKNGKTLTGN